VRRTISRRDNKMASKEKRNTKIGIIVLFVIFALFFMGPLLWVLSLSFKTVPELFYTPPKFLPEHFSFDNYIQALWNADILAYLLNSVRLVVGTLIVASAIIIPAAYAFSRIPFKGSKTFQFCILIFQMISPLIISIPLYRYFSTLGLLNNWSSLTLIYVALVLPFGTWTLKGYFDTIPFSIDEAGTIDGCTRWQVLTKILMPLIVPGLISVIVIMFVTSWAQFIVPFIMLSDSRMFPVSVGLVNMQSSADTITTHLLAAACIIAIAPTLFVFIILQKYIVSALTAGAVKG
jgi:multiple sugar transport system permease protein